ncbi:uncharacterized protein TNCV_3659111 [Trichonephila clavipes]|nr:uncharacterized protein TNCV_3659111 [Trichonephila clavipes]
MTPELAIPSPNYPTTPNDLGHGWRNSGTRHNVLGTYNTLHLYTTCTNIIVAHPVQWLATLTAMPLSQGSNPGEDMDVCKCIVPSRHGGTLKNCRGASPLVRLVEGEEWSRCPNQVVSLKRDLQCLSPQAKGCKAKLPLPSPRIELGPVVSKRESATRGLLATDHVILNYGQVTWTTPELGPPLLITTPHQWEDVRALDRFDVHRSPTWRVLSGTGLELMTCLP